MRIAFFADSFRTDLGGLTRAVIQLHDALVDRGLAVRVFALPQTRGPLHPGDVQMVTAFPLSGFPGFPPDSLLAWGYHRIRKQLSEWKPDVVHLHTPLPTSWLGLAAARSLGIPAVATYHANLRAAGVAVGGGKLFDSIVCALGRRFYNQCGMVIAPSDFARRQLRALGVRRPIAVISNGIDLQRFSPPTYRPGLVHMPPEPVTALYAGRLSREKGMAALEKTLCLAMRTEPRIRVRVAGDGPGAAALHRALAAHVADDRVSMLGHIPWERMPFEYQRADLLFFPSPNETQGLAALEAMATGLPVIAARAGALPELINHLENGLLIDPYDTAGMAQAIVGLARSPFLRARLGECGRTAVRQHDIRMTAQRIIMMYHRLRSGGDPAA
ncbi:MAG: glycosyltransferase [Bacillota bacterium]